jgi:hypothetical protein
METFFEKQRRTFEGDIKNLTGLQIINISHLIEAQQSSWRGPIQLRYPLHRAPVFHQEPIMDDRDRIHVITAARKWDRQVLPHINLVHITNPIRVRDFLVRYLLNIN